MANRYNIVSEDDLRMAVQKTTRYVDTLPTKQLVVSASSTSLLVRLLRPDLIARSELGLTDQPANDGTRSEQRYGVRSRSRR
jgi:hypothetical protein